MSIKVIVATHKACDIAADELYLPVHVGAAGKADIGFTRDDSGDNISLKNPHFCELTGLYWAWKNRDDDYIGLCHYRRYFGGGRGRDKKFGRVLTLARAEQLVAGRDGILPRRRNYLIENLYSHYAHTCHVEPLDVAGEIIAEKYPAYSAAFEQLKVRRTAHMFNMCVLRRDHLDAYCTWLFDILFELERRNPDADCSAFHARFYGRVSELLLDVWLSQNPLDCVELPVVDIDGVNWLKKGTAFLAAKFFGKKYEKSF